MRLVLDTNVLVSGLLNPHAVPGRIVALLAAGEVALCFDARIVSEYEDVLRRDRFGFPAAMVDLLLHQVLAEGTRTTGLPLSERLPDPDDEPFLEVALAAGCPLVTGNQRHFPDQARDRAVVLTPAEFLEVLREA